LLIGVPLAIAGALLAWRMLPRLLPEGTIRLAPGLPAAIATMGLLNLAFFGVDAFVPLALTDIRGTSTRFAGLALTAATVTWTSGSWLQAHLARRASPRKVIRTGFTLLSLGFIGMLIVVLTDVSVYGGIVAWAFAGIGIGMSYASMSLVVVESAPTGEEGTATSSMQLTNTLGAAVATGLGGAFVALLSTGDVASKSSLMVQYLAMLGVLACAYLAAARLPSQPRRTA
jgi:MFS family permease